MSVLPAIAADVSLIIGVALLAVAVLRRHSAALRHAVLAAAVIAALAAPLFEMLPGWSLWTAPPPVAVAPTSVGVSITFDLDAAEGAATAAAPSAVRWDLMLLAVWAIGAGAGLLVLASGLFGLRRLASGAVTAEDLGSTRVLYSPRASQVVTWGLFWKPTILLPTHARDWTDARREIVLAHERAHIVRGDWALQLTASLLLCLHWFNPLVWVAHRRLRLESERACDDAVLGTGVSGSAYAGELIALATEASDRRRPWLTATAMAHTSTLEERIEAMLSSTIDRRSPTRRTHTAVMAVALLATLAITTATVATATATTGAAPATAQGASIAGIFYDQHGGLLPDVVVTLTPLPGGAPQTARADANGAFAIANLAAGDYEVVARLPGFAPVRNVITLSAGERLQRHIMLPLGSLMETVTVASNGSPETAPTVPAARPARVIPEPRVASPCVGRVGGCIKTPRKVFDVKPIYPQALAAGGVGGRVVFIGRIGLDGYMSDLRVTDPPAGEAAPHPDLVQAAYDAVRRWEFQPTLLNGAPVEAAMTITVNFSVR